MDIPLLTDIVIIFALSLAVLLVFHAIRLPTVVGYFLTGIMAGPHGFGLIKAVHEVEVMAEIGVILLLFAIGIEFSFKKLIEIKKQVVIGGTLQVGLTIIAVYLITKYLGLSSPEALFCGFLVALSSTAIVLKLLQEKAEIDSPNGRVSLGILLFQDVIIVPMILITPFLSDIRPDSIDSNIFLLAIEGLAIIALILAAAKWFMPWLLHKVARTRSREIFLLSIVAICLSIAWLTSNVGLSLALGAFIAGLIISESEYSHQALGNILPFRNMFTSFFFVSIGMLLDTGFMAGNLVLILAVSVGVIAIKGVVTGGVALLLGLPLRSAILTGLSICQIGEFSFVLSKTGVEHALLGNYYQLFLAVTVLTMAASPFIISFANHFADLILKIPLPLRLKTGFWPLPDVQEVENIKQHLIIIGYGLNGRNVARAAKMTQIPYVIIEMSPDTVKTERAKGEPIIYGDAIHEEVLRHARIGDATVVVVAINDPAATRAITENLRNMTATAHLIIRTRFVTEMRGLYKLGADEVIPEEFETSVEIFSRVLAKYLVPKSEIDAIASNLRADGYEMFRSFSGKSSFFTNLNLHLPDVEVSTIRVDEKTHAAGKSLLELELRKKFGVTLLAVRRDVKTIPNPEVDMPLLEGDLLYLMGTPEKLAESARLFSSKIKGSRGQTPSEII